jgi:hypothetical protein
MVEMGFRQVDSAQPALPSIDERDRTCLVGQIGGSAKGGGFAGAVRRYIQGSLPAVYREGCFEKYLDTRRGRGEARCGWQIKAH